MTAPRYLVQLCEGEYEDPNVYPFIVQGGELDMYGHTTITVDKETRDRWQFAIECWQSMQDEIEAMQPFTVRHRILMRPFRPAIT